MTSDAKMGNTEEVEEEVPTQAWPPKGYYTGDESLDAPVQATHVDAAAAKKMCADIGYFHDPWLQHIVPLHMCNRRLSPMMHRGYFTRVQAMRRSAEMFIRKSNPNMPVQIVNLGAGLDSLFFYVKENIKDWGRDMNDFTQFELDFPIIIAKKTRTMVRKKDVLGLKLLQGGVSALGSLGGIDENAEWTMAEEPKQVSEEALKKNFENGIAINSIHQVRQLCTEHLRFVGCDMRRPDELTRLLLEAGFNQRANTLFISECVMIYMQSSHADGIIKTANEICVEPSALTAFCTYEQCNPNTAFGRQMVHNIRLRGCPLLGIEDYPTQESHQQRYKTLGWKSASSLDMNGVYDEKIPLEEKQRITKLELLDELEEFRLIQEHYFVLVASNQESTEGLF